MKPPYWFDNIPRSIGIIPIPKNNAFFIENFSYMLLSLQFKDSI